MSDRFFNLSDWEAKAIVEGRKTVLRRPVALGMPINFVGWPCDADWPAHPGRKCEAPPDGETHFHFSNGFNWQNTTIARPGDTLVGRECFQAWTGGDMGGWEESEGRLDRDFYAYTIEYRAGGDSTPTRWRSSATMPRWAARIVRPVLSVRVERLQDVDEADAVREGIGASILVLPSRVFGARWDAHYEKRSLGWDVNPFVWRVEFGGAA